MGEKLIIREQLEALCHVVLLSIRTKGEKNMIFSAMLASSNLLYGTKTIMEELHSARLAAGAAGACTDRAGVMCTCAMLLLSFRSANQKKCNVLICEKR